MGKIKETVTEMEETVRLAKRAERMEKSKKKRKKRLTKDEIYENKWN